jgi:hypothetical protein
MHFKIETITPARAAELLKRNYPHNRDLREHRCASLARAIEQKKFRLTHQPIAISPKPEQWLLDGQHRLRSCILANEPIEVAVAYDVPEAVYSVLDSGMSRTMSERLKKPRRSVYTCTALFKHMVGRRQPQEFEIELMLELFDPAIQQFAAVRTSKNTPIDKASFSAAIALRIASALKRKDESEVMRIRHLIDAMRQGRVEDLTAITRAFYRQIHEGVKNLKIDVSQDVDQFCRAWVAFDPERAKTVNLQISDHSTALKESRAAFAKIAHDVFD